MSHLILAAAPKPLMVPRACGQVVESNQVHILAAAVFGDFHQLFHALESRLASEVIGNVALSDFFNRIDNDRAIVHCIAAAHLDSGLYPDADRAPDAPTPDAVAELFREYHKREYGE